ncbi:rhomboid family intramembrane serine protease [Clostridium sp. MCC353]|uniref:rhomboid family intramembrane serine protease n=1 Tax=Clostridium sp. MCC353 TaxID=2592646 RepID=UPI001C037393|nr:rhomboid family intramembrane serine protease [Clostridium sp. MCC353]MBT9776148.1 rhomboid family intramembrane serine protease [Clostridium sp. MCC353]
MDNGRRKNIAYVNGAIIAVNVIYFLYLELAGSTDNLNFMVEHGAMYAPYVVEYKEYYRLFTSIFMHFGIDHILNNMVILFVLGDNLERALGKVKYLLFYIVCGVGANIISMQFNISQYRNVVSAGASGAIFGVIGGLLYAVVVNRGQLEDLSTRQLVMVIGCSLYFGFIGGGVDNAAHISGLILGILMSMILYRKPRLNRDYEI